MLTNITSLQGPAPVWVPSPAGARQTNLARFMAVWQVRNRIYIVGLPCLIRLFLLLSGRR